MLIAGSIYLLLDMDQPFTGRSTFRLRLAESRRAAAPVKEPVQVDLVSRRSTSPRRPALRAAHLLPRGLVGRSRAGPDLSARQPACRRLAASLVGAAREDGEVLGFAAISLTYSLVEPTPEKRPALLAQGALRADVEQNLGVGRALMAWVRRYAIDNGCARIDWPVKATNDRGSASTRGSVPRKWSTGSATGCPAGLGRLAASTRSHDES
jgi:GNAT superfamily N-acetyltransferase